MLKALTPMEERLSSDTNGAYKRDLLNQLGAHLIWTRHRLNENQTPESYNGYRNLYVALQSAEEVIKALNQ